MSTIFRPLARIVVALVVVCAAAVAIAPYTFLPGVLERSVAGSLQSQLGTPAPPEVSLRSDPRWRMLAGDFSGGRVELAAPEVGGISPDSVTLELDPFDVDVWRSVTSERLLTERPISGTIEAAFSERTLTEVARANAEGYPVRGVRVEGGLLVAEAEADVLGVALPVSVGGRPGVAGNRFVFTPERVRAAGVEVPERIAAVLLAGTSFAYPLGELPYGLLMDDARVEGERLVVSGQVADVLDGRAGARGDGTG